jgi:hypothetical protein
VTLALLPGNNFLPLLDGSALCLPIIKVSSHSITLLKSLSFSFLLSTSTGIPFCIDSVSGAPDASATFGQNWHFLACGFAYAILHLF